MSDLIFEVKKDGLTFKMFYDYDQASLIMDDLYYEHTLISNHRGHLSRGPEKDHYTLTELMDMYQCDDLPGHIHPVYAYIHSGISLSLSRDGYPFNCPFDSGLFGFVISENPEYFVQDFNSAQTNSYYGFCLEGANGEDLGSCWGFGGYSDNKDLIAEMLSHCDVDISNDFIKKITDEANKNI